MVKEYISTHIHHARYVRGTRVESSCLAFVFWFFFPLLERKVQDSEVEYKRSDTPCNVMLEKQK